MAWKIQLGQSIAFATVALISLNQGKIFWTLYHLTFAVGFAALTISKWREAQWAKSQSCRIENMLALSRELRVAVTDEEFWRVVDGDLSLLELREILTSRQKILWSHARTDCRYFSGSVYLKCAVNPSGSCEGCRWFESS